jgi:hypothetical protein
MMSSMLLSVTELSRGFTFSANSSVLFFLSVMSPVSHDVMLFDTYGMPFSLS